MVTLYGWPKSIKIAEVNGHEVTVVNVAKKKCSMNYCAVFGISKIQVSLQLCLMSKKLKKPSKRFMRLLITCNQFRKRVVRYVTLIRFV